jgi:TM2 domain-containing membrane protein YozV
MPSGNEPGAPPPRRSPLLAVVLSGLFPGLGQLYNREPLKGLLFGIGG